MLERSIPGWRVMKNGGNDPLPDAGEVDVRIRGHRKRLRDEEHAVVTAVAQADRPRPGRRACSRISIPWER